MIEIEKVISDVIVTLGIRHSEALNSRALLKDTKKDTQISVGKMVVALTDTTFKACIMMSERLLEKTHTKYSDLGLSEAVELAKKRFESLEKVS